MELEKLKILIVEDNISALRMLEELLMELGVRNIFSEIDGREAQKFLDREPNLVDMIICDWRMPRMTGLELLQQIRIVYPDMPFMMLTANTDADSVTSARKFGVTAYIAKPYSIEQLRTKLSALAMQL